MRLNIFDNAEAAGGSLMHRPSQYLPRTVVFPFRVHFPSNSHNPSSHSDNTNVGSDNLL
jgi:hypothetical protein